MTQEEIRNLEIGKELDAPDAIPLPNKDQTITLRDVLTSVYNFQEREDRRWITKFVRKNPASVDDVVWEIPLLYNSAFATEDGSKVWKMYYIVTKECLRRLTSLGLLWSETKYSQVAEKYLYYYGVTSIGKAFVNYNEKT